MLRIHRNADACIEVDRHAVADEAAAHGLDQAACEYERRFLTESARDDQKLGGTGPRYLVVPAREAHEPARDFAQHRVTDFLAERSANAIDVDEIEREQCERLAALVHGGNCTLQVLRGREAVR